MQAPMFVDNLVTSSFLFHPPPPLSLSLSISPFYSLTVNSSARLQTDVHLATPFMNSTGFTESVLYNITYTYVIAAQLYNFRSSSVSLSWNFCFLLLSHLQQQTNDNKSNKTKKRYCCFFLSV